MKKSLLSLLLLLLTPQSIQASDEVEKTVILGGGVGALTSAVYLGRAGMKPLVIVGSQPGGAIAKSHHVQNWPGEKEITGSELAERIRSQAEGVSARFVDEEVIRVDLSDQPYTITTRDLMSGKERSYRTETCIIALGATPRMLGVPGEKELWGNGVTNCAVCDGALYQGKRVAVVGGGESALTEADYLSKIAEKVIVIVRKDQFRTKEELLKKEVLARPNLEVLYETIVEKVEGTNGVTSLLLRNTRENRSFSLPVDGLFLAIGSTPNSDLFKGMIDLDEQGYVVLHEGQKTSKEGVYALGDISDPVYRQAISAAGDGAKAALQAEKLLAHRTVQLASMTKEKASSKKKTLPEPEHVHEVASVQEFDALLKSGSALFVDFYATWCGPCKSFSPIFHNWADQCAPGIARGKVQFLKVNVDKLPAIAKRYDVRGVPTLLVIDEKGKVQDKRAGLPGIASLFEQHSSPFRAT